MMSVGERRGVVPVSNGVTLGRKSKPSRLEALQADLQSKILRDKEKKLMKRVEDNENTSQAKPNNRFREHDSLSAPGGVRSFFQERRSNMAMPNSAGKAHTYQVKKKEGYDKSRPLQPITRNTQKVAGLPARGMSDPTLISSSKQEQTKPTDFQNWRMEQDTADKQRRLNALNRKTRQHSPGYQAKLDEYEQEAAELRQLQEQEEIQRRALVIQRKEEEKERKALLKQKQEQKRLEQAERGRRRKEESERRQRELAAEIQREKEAEEVELEQAEMIRQLEEQLKEKQRDLVQIQQRKPRDSPDHSTPRRVPQPSSPETQYNSSRHNVSSNRAAGGDGKSLGYARVDHPPSRNNHSDEENEYIPPTKPKKVNRKEVRAKLSPQDINISSQPSQAKSSPQRANSKAKPHELNSTYKVSREKSIPIATHTPEQLDPFVVDGEGLDVILVPCAVCGRRFAEDRLAKHQLACKKSHKPRKQFNTTAQRIAGSGAESFQYKQKQAQNKKQGSKKDWRAQREEFINALRYAKKAAAIEAKGGNVAELLPPPPKAENPDYVQCPHCNRKFNETAAERHIPKCKDIKAKPSMLKKGRRR